MNGSKAIEDDDAYRYDARLEYMEYQNGHYVPEPLELTGSGLNAYTSDDSDAITSRLALTSSSSTAGQTNFL